VFLKINDDEIIMNNLFFSFLIIVLILLEGNLSYVPTVGIVSMQKNEADILPYWLEYHAAIVGAKNIVILDSKSNNETQRIYKKWLKKGVTVLYNQGPYNHKGNLTFNAFQSVLSHVDIALPLDGDEFLVGYHNSLPVINKTKILNDFQAFWESNATCWAMVQYFNGVNLYLNDTVTSINHFSPSVYSIQTSKKVLKRHYMTYLDHGGHKPKLKHNGTCYSAYNRVGLLHYHFRNGTVTAERALNDVMGFGWLPENLTLATARKYKWGLLSLSRKRIGGRHKVKELFQYYSKGPATFIRKFNSKFVRMEPVNQFSKMLNASCLVDQRTLK
jgi:hypothetical protein